MTKLNKVITLTELAQEHFAKLIAREDTPNLNLRIEVINPGTSNAEINLTYCPVNQQETTDVELAFEKFNLYIEANSIAALQDAKIDYKNNDLGGEIVFKAPHIYGKKLDRNLPLKEQIEIIIDSEINPVLANHNGSVVVHTINEEIGELMLEFNGGCQGCGMAKVTLTQYIEKVLFKHFPQITSIRDVTNH